MKTVFILVLCSCTTYVVVESSPMSCTMDGTITYTGVPGWVKSVASDCGKANIVNKTIVITNCAMETPVTVNLYNKSVSAQPNPTTHPFMLDGSGALKLTCQKAANGQKYTVKVQFPGSVTPTVFASEEQISLTMSLTDHNSNTAPTTVALGQTYDLHVSGGGTHLLKIKTCEAATTEEMESPVTIYDSTPSDSIGLIKPISPIAQELVGTLTGFRLVTSPVVVLQCDIYVCTSTTCPPPQRGKRKRTKPKFQKASVRFEVMSTRSAKAVNGARDMNSVGKNMMTLVMVVVASYLSF